jgi:hypothetical protein
METKKINGLLMGALAGSLLGSVGSAILTEENLVNGASVVRNLAERLYQRRKAETRSPIRPLLLAGAGLGLLVGVGSVFLNSKTTKRTRNQLLKEYTRAYDNAVELMEAKKIGRHIKPRHHKTSQGAMKVHRKKSR